MNKKYRERVKKRKGVSKRVIIDPFTMEEKENKNKRYINLL
jgi:hypothetical protein